MSGEIPPEETRILYLEPDDEITSVVHRLADLTGGAILVAPGRSRATSSLIGLRLLARRAAAAGIDLRLVADPASRLLAAEVGIPAYASVAEAEAGGTPGTPELPPRPRAAIHVVRGERSSVPSLATGTGPVAPAPAPAPPGVTNRTDDTQAVPVVTPPPPPRRASRSWRFRRPRDARAWAWTGVSLLVLAAIVAAILPGATIRITPAPRDIGPFDYTLTVESHADAGTLTASASGDATGTYDASTPATGTVFFANYSARPVGVPRGTAVSAGDQVFVTDEAVTVAGARGIDNASTAEVAVSAQKAGPGGNVEADAIDTIDAAQVRADLCAQFFICTRRLVANRDPLSGGETKTGPEITQDDVNKLVAQVGKALDAKLADHFSGHGERLYAPASGSEDPKVPIPGDLVGTRDTKTFSLDGSLDFDRRYVLRDDVSRAAADRLKADASALPQGTSLMEDTITVGDPALSVAGDATTVRVSVRAGVTPVLDDSQLKARVAGLPRDEAIRALDDIGPATVDLWPGWVDAVPRLPFRISIAIDAPSPTPSASAPRASASP